MPKHMTPVELAQGIQENFAKMTVEIAANYIGEDCVIHEAPSLPFGGDWVGPQGFVDLITAVGKLFPDFSFTADSMVSDGADHLAFAGRIRGSTPQGSFDMPLVEYWTCRDGRIREVFAMWQDTKQIADLL